MKYANLVIDNRSDSTDIFYTYGCDEDHLKVGSKVYVPFAKGNRLREAYVVSLTDNISDDMRKKLKFIEKIDKECFVTLL